MADLESVEQAFLANLTQYLKALDDAIGKAGEFAAASKEAEDAVVSMALAADEAAGLVAAAMGGATGSVRDMRTALGLAGGAADLAGRNMVDAGVAAELAGGAFGTAAERILDTGAAAEAADPAVGSLRDRLAAASAASGGLSRSFLGLMGRTVELRAVLGLLDDELQAKIADLGGVAAASVALAAAMKTTDAAAADSGRTASVTAGFWARWGGVIHWVVAGTAEFLAVAIPAMVAAGAAGAVMAQGIGDAYEHAMAMYDAQEATANILHQTIGEWLGWKSVLQDAQNAIDPKIFELLGAGINIAKADAGGFVAEGTQVVNVLDDFAAKITGELTGAVGSQLHDVLSGGVRDLTEFGQVLGNAGHFLLSFAEQMPGLASVLLRLLSAFTDLAKGVVDFAQHIGFAGVSVLTAVIAFEEFNRWGSLLVGLFTRLGLGTVAVTGGFFSLERAGLVMTNLFMVVPNLILGIVANLGVMIGTMGAADGALASMGGSMLAFAGGVRAALLALEPWQMALIAIAAVGLGIFIDKLVTARSAAQEFAASLQASTEAASDISAYSTIAANLGKITGQLHEVSDGQYLTATYGDQAAHAMARQGYATAVLSSATGTFTGEQQKQYQAQQNLLAGAGHLEKAYGTSFVGALEMAQAAGVKLQAGILGQGQAADMARLKIANYVAGMQAMGESSGMAGHDVTLLGIASALAATKVDTLNQAVDGFVNGVTGGTSDLATLVESFQNMGHVVSDTADHLGDVTGGTTLDVNQFAHALTSFSGNGAAAWSNFDQALSSSGEQLADWYRTAGAMGAVTAPQMTQAMKDIVAQFVPFARYSTTAQKELVGFAQAQGLNVTTFPQLVRQLKDAGAGEKSLAGITDDVTGKVSDLNAVAQALGASVGSDAVAAMNSARLAATQLGTSAQQMATSWYKANVVNSGVISGFQGTFRALYDVDQNVSAAKAGADAYAQSLGLNATEIAYLNTLLGPAASHLRTEAAAGQAAAREMDIAAQAARNLATAIADIKNKTVYVDVIAEGAGLDLVGSGRYRITAPGAAHGFGPGGASRGPAVVGEEGPELMWMRGGEHVLPAPQTAALLRMAGAARGYAGGTGIDGEIRRDLAELVARLLGTYHAPAPLLSPLAGLETLIRDAAKHHDITSGTETRLTRMLHSDNKELRRIEQDRAGLLKKLADAEKAYLARVAAQRQYASSVTSAAESGASLSSVMSGTSGPVSSSYLLASMRIDLGQIRQFDSDIRKLERLGLDRNLLNQIIQMGPASGLPVAEALINGPLSNIQHLNATEAQIGGASRELGRQTAHEMYGAGIQAARGLVRGIEDEKRFLEAVMRDLARSMVHALKDELKIHSPSQVTRDIGRSLMDGIPLGVADRMPSLDSSLRSAAGHVSSALGSAAGAGGGGDIVLNVTVPVTTQLDGRPIYKAVQTQAVRVSRRNQDNRLAVTRGRG